MNFCVVPREIREINKRGGGGQNKLRGRVSKTHEKIKRPPPFILNLRVNYTHIPIYIYTDIQKRTYTLV